MKRRYIPIVMALVISAASWGFGQTSKVGRVDTSDWSGKTSHLTIKAPVTVGTTVLPAGEYDVREATRGDQSVVEFFRIVAIPNPAYAVRVPPQGSPVYVREKVAEVSCTRSPLVAKAKKTEAVISTESARLTQLQIKGDDGADLF
jgi:hypothetical protein